MGGKLVAAALPKLVSRSEDELVQDANAGDDRAFELLYRQTVDSVFGLVTRLLGRSPEVEDLVQQVYLEAYRGLSGFRGDSSFSTWLHQIAIHVTKGALRKQRRRPRFVASSAELESEFLTATHCSDPHARALLHVALRHLSGLKPELQIAFILRHVEQMTLKEIGKLVGATGPAVGQRVKKAQHVLADRIDRENKRALRKASRDDA